MVEMNGALITAGSKPSRRASSGSSEPMVVASGLVVYFVIAKLVLGI
jgi:hypothetical protein